MWKSVAAVLFGAGFTVATALAMGSLLLQVLRIKIIGAERVVIGFVVGAACLSAIVFWLCLLHAATWSAFVGIGTIVIALSMWRGHSCLPRPDSSRRTFLPLIILLPFALAYFVHALAPEISPDGTSYHLGNVLHYWHAHGFDWSHRGMYAYMPQGMEMLFLFAFTLGGYSSAALVHFAFFAALAALIAFYGVRIGARRAGWFAAVIVFTSPVAGIVGSSAYNDLALATAVFAVFFLLQVFADSSETNLLWLIGLFAGFAYSIKYTGALAMFLALAMLPWRSWWRVMAPGAVLAMPWAIRNWIWAGNPFAPFFNRWFPNPWFHFGAEQSYLADVRTYNGVHHWWEIPLQLASRGGKIPGIVGPVFLLAPVALLALRWRNGRKLLLAAGLLSLPAFANTDARFLLPALPFVALAMGMALSNSLGVLPALALFEAIVCWPSVLSVYCDASAWRLREIPWRAALRSEPEAAYLTKHVRDYSLKSPIEANVPPDEKIFSFVGRAEAYIDREIVVGYESALGNRLQDALQTIVGQPPLDLLRFSFTPVNARGVRVVQMAGGAEYWTVAEMQMKAEGRELAWPNAAESSLAFDGNPATRWSTWEAMRPGARLGVEFSGLVTISEVTLQCAAVGGAQLRVEYLVDDGQWRTVEAREEHSVNSPEVRRNATAYVKLQGVRFLLVDDRDFTGEDMRRNSAEWGITELARNDEATLYRID